METTAAFARPFARRPVALAWLGGFGAARARLSMRRLRCCQPIVAAIAGAGGLALLRWARAERPYSAALIAIDAAAFAIFAYQRNDSLGFWQLAGPVGGRLSVRHARRGDRADHLRRRLDPRAHRRLSGIAAHRGAEPHRDPVPVQPFACSWRRLAHGRTRRRGDGARQSALSSAGRDRTRADPVVHRRGDPHSDQPGQRQPAAAVAPHACAVRAERRARGRYASVRQCGAMGRSALPGDLFFRSVRGAGSSRLMGDRLSSDRRCARLARRPSAALRGGLGALADWLHQGRDLRRAVHGADPDRGPDLERARRDRFLRQRRAHDRPACRRAPLSARAHDRRQRRRNAALLRAVESRLSRSARTRARACRRARPRARLSRQSRGLRRRRALPRHGRDRRALLRRRRPRLRRGERDPRRAAETPKLAALRAWRSARRPGRRRARLVFRHAPGSRRDRQILGLCRRQLSARRPQARRFHHLSDLQQIWLDQPRRGRGRRQAVLDRVGGGRDQLVARRAAVLDQLRSARRGAAREACVRSRRF